MQKISPLFSYKLMLSLALAATLSSCASINSETAADLDCCCVRPAPEMVAAVAVAEAPITIEKFVEIKPADHDQDGIIDEHDRCPNTEAGKQVDARGCPEILISLHGINFNSGSSAILTDSAPKLAKAVEALQASVGVSVIIEGHTDNVRGFSYNQLLSLRRANTVREYLIEHGVDAQRLVAVGHGETNPMASNNTSEGRYQNRRVDLRTVGTAFIKDE